jgi:lyso-ornithine lipid O-acyltransferase
MARDTTGVSPATTAGTVARVASAIIGVTRAIGIALSPTPTPRVKSPNRREPNVVHFTPCLYGSRMPPDQTIVATPFAPASGGAWGRRRPRIGFGPRPEPGFFLALPPGRDGWLFARRLRAARRAAAIALLTLPSMLIQALCLLLPGAAKVAFPKLYWSLFARALGLRVRVIGEIAGKASGRPVVFVCNHCSWIDIPVLGGVLPAAFVSKAEIAGWPVVATIARLGRTVFVSRRRGATARERDALRAVLDGGGNLILFPEGTSSDGSRVLPFRTAFFAVAEGTGQPPLIQPVSVVYDRLNGLPAGRAARPVFAWYGDMDIASHFWRMTQHLDMRATVLLHAPIDPARFADRKTLAAAVWRTVADGAAMLRQNRPPRPLTADSALPPPPVKPAFA